MATFEYRGYMRDGSACAGTVEAAGLKEARERLVARGVLAERVRAVSSRSRLAAFERATVYRELASLLKAGIPVAAALHILLQAPVRRAVRSCIESARERLEGGAPFGEALGAGLGGVAAFESAALAAGERSGGLVDVLNRLATHLDERDAMTERLRSALIYPSIVVSLGVIAGAVMLGVLLPKVRELLPPGQELPGITRAVLAVGGWTSRWGLVVLVAVVAGVVWFGRLIAGDRAMAVRCAAFRHRVPVLRDALRLLVNLRFAETLALLLRAGSPMVESLEMAGRATGDPWVEARVRDAAEAVRHGEPLPVALGRVVPLGAQMAGLMEVGQASGDIAGLMETAALQCRNRWDHFSARLLAGLEPVMVLVAGAFVLLVALSVLLPIVSMSTGLGK